MWPTRKLLCFVWFIVSWIRLPRKVVCRRLEKGVHYVYVLRKNREVRFEKQTLAIMGAKIKFHIFTRRVTERRLLLLLGALSTYVRNYEKKVGIWNGNLSNFLLILNSKWSFAAVPMQNNSFWSVLLEFAVERVIFSFPWQRQTYAFLWGDFKLCVKFLP